MSERYVDVHLLVWTVEESENFIDKCGTTKGYEAKKLCRRVRCGLGSINENLTCM